MLKNHRDARSLHAGRRKHGGNRHSQQKIRCDLSQNASERRPEPEPRGCAGLARVPRRARARCHTCDCKPDRASPGDPQTEPALKPINRSSKHQASPKSSYCPRQRHLPPNHAPGERDSNRTEQRRDEYKGRHRADPSLSRPADPRCHRHRCTRTAGQERARRDGGKEGAGSASAEQPRRPAFRRESLKRGTRDGAQNEEWEHIDQEIAEQRSGIMRRCAGRSSRRETIRIHAATSFIRACLERTGQKLPTHYDLTALTASSAASGSLSSSRPFSRRFDTRIPTREASGGGGKRWRSCCAVHALHRKRRALGCRVAQRDAKAHWIGECGEQHACFPEGVPLATGPALARPVAR
jgi:hypothetical protein